MEVHHRHKPVRNWGEFAKEVGIIVLGVVIALGGEQAVEALHHRSEVRETRTALNEELGLDLASLADATSRSNCVSARLSQLERWQKSLERGQPLKLEHKIVVPGNIAIRTSVWRVSAGDAVSRMPLKPRVAYAKLYDGMDLANREREILYNSWLDLSSYQDARRLSDAQQIAVTKDIGAIVDLNEVMAANYERMRTAASELGAVPINDPIFAAYRAKHMEICKTLLAK